MWHVICCILAGFGVCIAATVWRWIAMDTYNWLPKIAEWILKQAARKLPESEREERIEIWKADQLSIPGNLSKLINAIDTFRACLLINKESQHTAVPRQIHNVVNSGIELTPEARLEAGDQVRFKSGPFSGYEGWVVRRRGKTRLTISVQFLEQGVSMSVDESQVEPR